MGRASALGATHHRTSTAPVLAFHLEFVTHPLQRDAALHSHPTILQRRTHAFRDIDDPEDALAVYAIEIALALSLVLICVIFRRIGKDGH